jgi:hypothetical protein
MIIVSLNAAFSTEIYTQIENNMKLPTSWQSLFYEAGDMFRFSLRFFRYGYKPRG